jgi:spermidine/putrescine transport system permease protein
MQTLPGHNPENPNARRPGWMGWLLLAPMVVWLFLFVVAPMAILLVYSFCNRDDLGRVVFSFTWSNYARVFEPI